jgi:hypothetical protein
MGMFILKEPQSTFNWINRNTEVDKPEEILAEMSLIESVRLTNTLN